MSMISPPEAECRSGEAGSPAEAGRRSGEANSPADAQVLIGPYVIAGRYDATTGYYTSSQVTVAAGRVVRVNLPSACI